MSLSPRTIDPIPEYTARVARAAFRKGNLYMTLRDELGTLFVDQDFADLFPKRGQPAQSPWRLALITLFQFAEGLSDRQAAEAVRSRIDWKYALSLELTDDGFDSTVLCEFRTRLLENEANLLLFNQLLQLSRQRGWLKAGGRQRTDSTHVLAAVRSINRVETVLETLRHALNDLAKVAPDWLRGVLEQFQPEWAKRYTSGWSGTKRLPTKKADRDALAAIRDALAAIIGADGRALLIALYGDSNATESPAVWLRHLPAVEMLRRVWMQNFEQTDTGIGFRDSDNLPPASLFISSPHDADAHLAQKGTTYWVGYKVHLTETCEPISEDAENTEAPHLITHVETTAAACADGDVTPIIHRTLKERDLLPGKHIVDTGYLDAELLATSEETFGVDLFGPTRPDLKWQARAGEGFDQRHFSIDWEKQQATCPEGKISRGWTPATDKRGNELVVIKFSVKDCRPCLSNSKCLRSKGKHLRRALKLRRQDHHEALMAAREREKTAAFQQEYALRSGIEGTLSRGVRTCGLRVSRYVGHAKVHLGNILMATALNLLRIGEWLMEMVPPATRLSPLARLVTRIA